MKKRLRYTLTLLSLIITLISCTMKQNNLTHEQIVKNYYDGLNTGDFDGISKFISDSIVTTEKDYILTQNKKELYRQFQWDSVFSPKYKLTDIKNDSNLITATVSKICKRIKFLQDSAMIYKVEISLNDNQITKIQTTDYIFLDFTKWSSRRDTLVAWINKNHPEISGFINDLTQKGAEKYLKAIDLYKDK